MKSEIMTNNPETTNNLNVKEYFSRENAPDEGIETNPVFEKLAEEKHETFYNYMERLGLVNDPNFLVLSSFHHYYYDVEDLKDVKTVVNLKQLNYMAQIKDFLHTIYHLLPQKSYFIGSFTDNKNQNRFLSGSQKSQYQVDQIENGVASRIPFFNSIFNLLDLKTNKYMTKRTVTLMLEAAGLKVLDMTEYNGLTYFCTQNVKTSAE
jgi:hypothetical protein